MSCDAENYERIVQSLLLSTIAAAGSVDLQAFHLKRYLGKSGQEHEIDVSFEIAVVGVRLLVVVECKDYARKVGVDDVMTFVYRLREIGAHKGLIVTTRGFQAGALTVAAAEGVGLLIAADGVLDIYQGVQYTLFEHWITQLELQVSSRGDAVGIVGKRYVRGNAFGTVVSLHALEPRRQDFANLAFLTPDEQPLLEAGTDRSVPAFRGYSREITSRENSNDVMVC